MKFTIANIGNRFASMLGIHALPAPMLPSVLTIDKLADQTQTQNHANAVTGAACD